METQLLDDIRAGRRKIAAITHSCERSGGIVVTLDDGDEFAVAPEEVQELLEARGGEESLDALFDLLG